MFQLQPDLINRITLDVLLGKPGVRSASNLFMRLFEVCAAHKIYSWKVSLHEAVILAVVNVLRVLYFLTAGSFHKVKGGGILL